MFSKLSFDKKVIFIVALSCLICGGFTTAVSIYFSSEELEKGIEEKAMTIHSRLEAATDYVALQNGLVTIIDKLKPNIKLPELSIQKKPYGC